MQTTVEIYSLKGERKEWQGGSEGAYVVLTEGGDGTGDGYFNGLYGPHGLLHLVSSHVDYYHCPASHAYEFCPNDETIGSDA
jgi:hypothetical protein